MNTPLLPAPDPEFQPATPLDDPTASHSALRIRRFLNTLLQFWWIPAATLAIGLAIAAAYVYSKVPTFVSNAAMWQTVKLTLPQGEVFSEDMQNFAGTLSGLLQNETLRQQALALLRTSTNSASIIRGKDGEPVPVDIAVAANAKSSIYSIRATGSNPWFTRTYLDAIMETYLEYMKTYRAQVSGDTLASVSDQMQRWERDLKSEQDALLAFEQTNNLAILQEEASVAGSYLTKLKTELSDLQLEARLLSATSNNTALGTNGTFNLTADMTSAIPASTTSVQQSSRNDLEVLKIQRDRLGKYLRPKHPKIVKLDEEIARAEQLQEVYRRENHDQLDTARQANQIKMENVLVSIQEWESKVVQANAGISEADRLKLDIQRTQNVYDRLAFMVENLGISRNIDQENLAILAHASPSKRSYTSEKTGLVLAILVGLGSGLGIVFLISVRDDRFTSVTEVSSTLSDPVVGLLPDVGQKEQSVIPLLALNDPRHIYAESYRSLRSALFFQSTEGERPRILLITSASPNEGKSTVAANLAHTLAASGSRVLLVDGDLRKGHLHRLLGLQKEPGLAELLNQSCEPDKVMQKDAQVNLTFIASGELISGNPGDLFLGSGLDQILFQWRQEFDFVVIDSSPLFAADDASCLAPKVDGVLFVVRSRYSSARAAREALEMLAQRQARVLGVIFNGADTSGRSYYYYKYADYYPRTKQS